MRSSEILERLLIRRPELLACRGAIEAAAVAMEDTYRRGSKVLICGNGGSAADGDHMVGELMKGFLADRGIPEDHRKSFQELWGEEGREIAGRLQRAIPAISLAAQVPLITAVVNDIGADLIFAQQVYGYGAPGDVLVAISTSGNSLDVVRAVQVARVIGMKTIGMAGKDGGRLHGMCEVSIRVPYGQAAEIQEAHEAVYHALCAMVEADLFGRDEE
ncbi:MAG: SIS domain-containing protein [Firmicutes bacterium]|nr:SIS domain-containing protein [Bacillota bacterium]